MILMKKMKQMTKMKEPKRNPLTKCLWQQLKTLVYLPKIKIQIKNHAKKIPPKLAYSEAPASQIKKRVKHLLMMM